MKSVSTTFNAVAHPLQSAQLVAVVAATLFAAATFIHPAAHAEDDSDAMFEENYPASVEISAIDSATGLADLERAFWICDLGGTVYGVDGPSAVACVAVTDELRQLKFDNDSELMTAWWRLNKAAQHASLEREITAAVAYQGSADTVEFPDSI